MSAALSVVNAFYMNVVGYKVGLVVAAIGAATAFYMNVVGYKAIAKIMTFFAMPRFI